VQAQGSAFFDNAERPFAEADVRDPKPKVKQTPLIRYAQGTALFIRARHSVGDEGAVRVELESPRVLLLLFCSEAA
jgi:hypothetical protein